MLFSAALPFPQVQQSSVTQIAAELGRLQEAAASAALSAADLGGGTITLSNIGEQLQLLLCAGCHSHACSPSIRPC